MVAKVKAGHLAEVGVFQGRLAMVLVAMIIASKAVASPQDQAWGGFVVPFSITVVVTIVAPQAWIWGGQHNSYRGLTLILTWPSILIDKKPPS